jgi:hypothetical protein
MTLPVALAACPSVTVPAFVAVAGERDSMRFPEFFPANIRDPRTRLAYP